MTGRRGGWHKPAEPVRRRGFAATDYFAPDLVIVIASAVRREAIQ